jgi:hypothetical protein
MTRRMLFACGLTLVLAAPWPAAAGEVHLTIKDGRVALVAHDATLREILLEWERVGGTRIVNRDRVPGTRLDLELPDVSEEQALDVLLRPIAGYMASRRLGPEGGASAFSRIILMPGAATPVAYAGQASVQPISRPGMGAQPGMSGAPPFGRPGMQRRVLPDGRVVTVMDDSERADPDDPADAAQSQGNVGGVMRPPYNAPRTQQGQAADDAPQADLQPGQAGQAAPMLKAAPAVPVTVGTPGALPATKPGAAPPKPPGD